MSDSGELQGDVPATASCLPEENVLVREASEAADMLLEVCKGAKFDGLLEKAERIVEVC